MKKGGNKKIIYLMVISFLITISNNVSAEESVSTFTKEEVKPGKLLFEGSQRLKNGGPSCISCHSVNANDVIPGGLYGIELTDAYQKYSVGLSAWLGNPNIPAMEASYQNNPLEEAEREELSKFLQYVMENKDTQNASDGFLMLSVGGLGGLVIILILVSLLWMNRKRKMVKSEIFKRQSKAADAKY